MDNKREGRSKEMGGYRSRFLMNFLIRAVLGMAVIFLANQFLEAGGHALHVGLNPLTFCTSGIFGMPGVALLYGIAFYQGL